MPKVDHEQLMRMALDLAERGRGFTHPNPMVGALIVKHGEVIATGHHERFGAPHAEAAALEAAGSKAEGATLYVTLEPCAHHGKTPPCTHAILHHGIKEVIIGCEDPNPTAQGGIDILRDNGIRLTVGVLQEECERLNEAFFKFHLRKLPFVRIKCAVTLDGRIAAAGHKGERITAAEANREVHQMRAASDAVLAGIGTVLADDPLLTVRASRGAGTRGPARIIVDTHARTPVDCRIMNSLGEAPAWIAVGESADDAAVASLELAGAEIIRCPLDEGRVDLRALLEMLAEREIVEILVEGGAEIVASLVGARLVDHMSIFVAPMLVGNDGVPLLHAMGFQSLTEAIRLRDVKVDVYGEDVRVSGYLPWA